MLVAPTSGPIGLVHWWALSPAAVVRMLAVLGFTDATVSLHSPPRMTSAPPLFTVVAHRPASRVVQVTAVSPPEAVLPREPETAAPELVDGLPMPPPHLRFLVAGTEEAESFLLLGRRGFDSLTRSVQRAGVELSELGQVLDFGCGVGRVLRHWHAVPGIKMHGTDLCEEAIDWAAKNLAFARFGTNGMAPVLAQAADAFGLVYALSVFTHLPGALQLPWFLELLRVVRPGGLLYLTTHGAYYRPLLGAGHQEEFDAGRLVVGGEEAPGSNHCAAYHPPAYMHSALLAQASVTLLEHLPCGATGNPMQDSWLIRKNL
jgi:SAM-dependent methyltransferase